MKEIAAIIQIDKVTLDKVSWDLEGISTSDEVKPDLELDMHDLPDNNEGHKGIVSFTFSDEVKTYFKCEVVVLGSTPGFPFKQILRDSSARKVVSATVSEMALGYIRSLLNNAMYLSGLNNVILIGGIVPAVLSDRNVFIESERDEESKMSQHVPDSSPT